MSEATPTVTDRPQRLAVLGAGAMGSALIQGWLQAGLLRPDQLCACDVSPTARAQLAETGIAVTADPAEAAADCDVLVVAVKPYDVAAVVTAALAHRAEPALLVSIAAGVTLSQLEALAPTAAVVRVMPNTPALVGEGAAAYALGSRANADDGVLVATLLNAVGRAVQVKEPLLDAVTGLSGSGPAYVFVLIEAMADGGVRGGLPRDVALELAAQTVLGAAKMVLTGDEHPAALKDRVASPGGTTIAGLAALEAAGFRSAAIEAVTAATQRSRELG